MANYKCHKCGIVDSLHLKDEGRSKLVCEILKGGKELDIYFIYCRSCNYVNFYQPGWMGNIKFQRYKSGREMFDDYEKIGHHFFIFYEENKINQAMTEDGILPKGWNPKGGRIENQETKRRRELPKTTKIGDSVTFTDEAINRLEEEYKRRGPEKHGSNEGKVIIKCVHCNGSLRVPEGKFGKIRCPICKEMFEVIDFSEVDPDFRKVDPDGTSD